MFHIVAINEKTGKKEYLTSKPIPHSKACNMVTRFTVHPSRRIQLEEVLV